MAVTQLKRKDRKNYTRQENRKAIMKQLTQKPVIRKVDVEELKAAFKA